MAYTKHFSTVYGQRTTGKEYLVEIYARATQGALPGKGQELELFDPGIQIQWQGDRDLVRAIMGSSLSFTANLTEAQYDKWGTILELSEDEIILVMYRGDTADKDELEWYGNLLAESISFVVENESITMTAQWTDGLGQLNLREFGSTTVSPPAAYVGFKSLDFWLAACFTKIPAHDFILERFASTSVLPVLTTSIVSFREVGLPGYEADYGPFSLQVDDGTFYKWRPQNSILRRLKVYGKTFRGKKKERDRLREPAPKRVLYNTADVLEDICKTFGAIVCHWRGCYWIVNRQALSFQTTDTKSHRYEIYADWENGLNAIVMNEDDEAVMLTNDFDDDYLWLAGAVETRNFPFGSAVMTHEEGGSDRIWAGGVWANTRPGSTATDQHNNFIPGDTNHRQYVFKVYDSQVDPQIPNQDPAFGSEYINFNHYKYPADPSGYMGFEAETVTDLTLNSGQNLRFQMGVAALFRYTTANVTYTLAGQTMIARVRIQFKDEDGRYTRLSRKVYTHINTSEGSDLDGIRIDKAVDNMYYRKLYRSFTWVYWDGTGTPSDDYDDAWYEIIMPHGDSVNSGDDWGTEAYPVCQQYNGATYAPIACQIQGEDTSCDGGGVIFELTNNENTHNQYMLENIRFELPLYNDVDDTVWKEFYTEQGVEVWLPNHGPRRNHTTYNDPDGDYFAGTIPLLGPQQNIHDPLWRSAYADGTGGIQQVNENVNFGNIGGVVGFIPGYYYFPKEVTFVGACLFLGDGNDDFDVITRVDNEDTKAVEILDVGSSRLGSRLQFRNTHVWGTLWGRVKSSASVFTDNYVENLRWTTHGNDLTASPIKEPYDSLHALVATEYLELVGEMQRYYAGTYIPKASAPTLPAPWRLIETDQLDKTNTRTLLPTAQTWTMNGGVSGEFLVARSTRYADIEGYQDVGTVTTYKGGGKWVVKPGLGGNAVGFETFTNSTTDIGGIDNTVGEHSNKLQFISIDDDENPVGIDGFTFESGSTPDKRFDQALRYGRLDPACETNFNADWSSVLGANETLETVYMVQLDQTGLYIEEDTATPGEGQFSRRKIYIGFGSLRDTDSTWISTGPSFPTELALQDGVTNAAAYRVIREFLGEYDFDTADTNPSAAKKRTNYTFLITHEIVDDVTYPLDDYTDELTAAYGLRRLLTDTTTDYLVRVTDGQNFINVGWDDNGDLDTTGLTVDANGDLGGTYEIITWYDQYGTNHLTQDANVANSRPTLYNNIPAQSSFNNIATTPCLEFSNFERLRLTDPTPLLGSAANTVAAVFSSLDDSSARPITALWRSGNGGANLGQQVFQVAILGNGDKLRHQHRSDSNQQYKLDTATDSIGEETSNVWISTLRRLGNNQAILNGTFYPSVPANGSASNDYTTLFRDDNPGSEIMHVGAQIGTGLNSIYFNGYIHELVFFATDSDDGDLELSDMGTIHNEMNTYHDIGDDYNP